nr:energy-coupling factor transporter transmembrane component T [Pseudohoeflea sp. DP4N28-3]
MLKHFHSLPKFFLCLIWIAASVLVFDLRFQVAAAVLAFALLWLGEGVRLWKMIVLTVPFALFGFGFLTTSVLFSAESGYALQMAGEQSMRRPDFSPGLVLFARTLACGLLSALFALTTDPGHFVRALMVHLRLPPSVGYALMQAMHLVPDLGREMQSLRMARAIRRGRALRRLPGPGEVAALTIPLLAFAIRRAGRAALAMEARGLQAGRPRSHLRDVAMTRGDAAGFAAGLALLAALLWAL